MNDEYHLEIRTAISTLELTNRLAENYGLGGYQTWNTYPVFPEISGERFSCEIHDPSTRSIETPDTTPWFKIELKQLPGGVGDVLERPATEFILTCRHPQINQENFRLAVEQVRQKLGGILK